MSSTRDNVRRFFEQFKSNAKVLVIINADPDAIGSAMAVKRLLWRRVSEVAIAHFNRISRPDNLALIQLTDVGLRNPAEVDKAQFDHFVIVDSQPDHNEAFAGITYTAIIDIIILDPGRSRLHRYPPRIRHLLHPVDRIPGNPGKSSHPPSWQRP